MVEKIGYPEICVNKTLLREYYQGVSVSWTTIPFFPFLQENNKPLELTFSILTISRDSMESETTPEPSANAERNRGYLKHFQRRILMGNGFKGPDNWGTNIDEINNSAMAKMAPN